MTTAAPPVATSSRKRSLMLWASIVAIGAAGIAIKMPFGLFMMKVLGRPTPASRTWMEWLFGSEWGWLCIAAVGALFLYERSGIRAAPLLERLFYPEMRSIPRSPLWRPALLAGLACTAFFAITLMLGLQSPLQQAFTNTMSAADKAKMAMLYPLAPLGAALSEEVIYRYGGLSILLGLASVAGLARNGRNWIAAFWIANCIQAAYFGYIHVAQGAVTSQAGGILVQTVVSPPTWSGFVLGYTYRRWGIETAMVGHMAADVFIPLFMAGWSAVALGAA